jgi:hypothetical protein
MTACRKHKRDPSMMQIMRARLSPGNDRYINEPPGAAPDPLACALFYTVPLNSPPQSFRDPQAPWTVCEYACTLCSVCLWSSFFLLPFSAFNCKHPHWPTSWRRYRLVVVEWHRHAAYRTSSVSTAPWLKAVTNVDPSHS